MSGCGLDHFGRVKRNDLFIIDMLGCKPLGLLAALRSLEIIRTFIVQ